MRLIAPTLQNVMAGKNRSTFSRWWGSFHNKQEEFERGRRTVVEDINWIIEFERLARPRLQKIFEEDLVGIPAALAERLEALRKREASNRADAEAEPSAHRERVERGGVAREQKTPLELTYQPRSRLLVVKFAPGHYDDNQVNVLHAAMKLACKELCISKTDQESRERVASMMMAFAKYGHIDVEKLKAFAVHQF